jgi:hypothetical protein
MAGSRNCTTIEQPFRHELHRHAEQRRSYEFPRRPSEQPRMDPDKRPRDSFDHELGGRGTGDRNETTLAKQADTAKPPCMAPEYFISRHPQPPMVFGRGLRHARSRDHSTSMTRFRFGRFRPHRPRRCGSYRSVDQSSRRCCRNRRTPCGFRRSTSDWRPLLEPRSADHFSIVRDMRRAMALLMRCTT